MAKTKTQIVAELREMSQDFRDRAESYLQTSKAYAQESKRESLEKGAAVLRMAAARIEELVDESETRFNKPVEESDEGEETPTDEAPI